MGLCNAHFFQTLFKKSLVKRKPVANPTGMRRGESQNDCGRGFRRACSGHLRLRPMSVRPVHSGLPTNRSYLEVQKLTQTLPEADSVSVAGRKRAGSCSI
jgi:hypothetical protein